MNWQKDYLKNKDVTLDKNAKYRKQRGYTQNKIMMLRRKDKLRINAHKGRTILFLREGGLGRFVLLKLIFLFSALGCGRIFTFKVVHSFFPSVFSVHIC